jgi:hypothetical protein
LCYGALAIAATPSIKVVKQSPWRGGSRLWSNRYHFNGGTPGSDAAWHTLMDNVVAAEKAIFGSEHEIVHCYGYAAGSDVPVSDKAYTTVGTLLTSGTRAMPLEVAVLGRYTTTARTSKNHPVYLFNFWHGALGENAAPDDTLDGSQKTAVEDYMTDWINGFSDGSNTYHRAGPNGASGVVRSVDQWLHHRDFPR